jgi:hypothetical protein
MSAGNVLARRSAFSVSVSYCREAAMRSSLLAIALVPGLFLLAPVALAQTTTEPPTSTTEPAPPPLPVWLKLSAYSGYAGERVSVAAACEADASPLTSEALQVTEPLARNAEGHQPWALFGETVIRDRRQGSYPVSFHCAGEPVTVYFTVLAKQKPVKSQTVKVPKGAPETGDGSL